jgi:prepilin-type processing-associated H-X9-DG protein
MMSDELPIPTPKSPPKRWTLSIRRMMGLIALTAILLALVLNSGGTYCGESARRSQCVNNLRQLGLAILSYESTNGVLPIGTVPDPDMPLNCRFGWNYLIAPELGLRGPFAEGDLSQPCDDSALDPLRSHPPGTESCPSIRQNTSANYVGIAGLGIDSAAFPKSDRRAGIFGDHRTVTLAEIEDGTSQTLMVVESSQKAGPWFAGGRNTVRGLDPSKPPYIGQGGQFGGIHSRGANVLMADGSVKFVKESIDPKVLEAMSTINGGEAVPAEFR